MAVKTDTLGKGWQHPFQFSVLGGIEKARGVELVKMSIRQIVATRIGSRCPLRAFGSPLKDLVFTPIQPDLEALLVHFVREAIEKWEKRVRVSNVSVDIGERNEGRVDISVGFTVITTQEEGNLVFPFFLSPAERKAQGV